jgi:dihydroxyacetone kinase-like predicted kinase
MNPSIEDLLKAIEGVRAKEVFVLPNNTNIILAAQQAAELTDRKVHVLPTKSVPMGISAAVAFQPDLSGDENEANMREAAEHVHTASITYAVRDTVFDGREIHEGDIMGIGDEGILTTGSSVEDVTFESLKKTVEDDTEIISIYYGAEVTEEDASALRDQISEAFPDCDVELQSGGQPVYFYILSAE